MIDDPAAAVVRWLTAAPCAPPITSAATTSSTSAANFAVVEMRTIAAPRFTPTMFTTAAKAMATAERPRAATQCVIGSTPKVRRK